MHAYVVDYPATRPPCLLPPVSAGGTSPGPTDQGSSSGILRYEVPRPRSKHRSPPEGKRAGSRAARTSHPVMMLAFTDCSVTMW